MGGTYERMNRLIHRAVVRDLDRIGQAAQRDMSAEQRQALSRRTSFLVKILRHHHEGEDEGIWTIATTKSPELRALAAEMESEHQALNDASEDLRVAAERYAGTGAPTDREMLAHAVEAMREVCLPHLSHEEEVAVPLLVHALDDKEWARAEKRFYKGVSLPYLAWILAWVLDGLVGDDAAYVRQQLPRPLMAFLGWGWQSRYDREATLAWGGLGAVRG